MSWNYRVVKDGESFNITEVYYDKNGEPTGYAVFDRAEKFHIDILTGWDSYGDLKGTAEKVLGAFDKPVLTLRDGKLS